MTESGLPSTHAEFLTAFVEVAGEGKGAKSHDGNDAGISKRQRLLTGKQKITGVMTAPVARYGLGGDDNLYLQLGLSVLHTASPDRTLAPAALYSVDVVHAIREGIQRNVLAEVKRRNQESEAKLEQVRMRLLSIFGVMGLNDLMQDADRMSKVLETQYKKADRDEFKDLLYRLQSVTKSKLAPKIETYMKRFWTPPPVPALATVPYAPPLPPAPTLDTIDEGSGEEDGEFQSAGEDSEEDTGASIVRYALARGLCGHRGPMEETTSCPTDRLLPYTAPKDVGVEMARARGMRVPDGAWDPPAPERDSTAAIDEAMAAFGGNYAIDDANENGRSFGVVRDARQVRWEPKGKHAVALATAAALEHAVARCTQLLEDSRSTLSEEAKLAITRARLCLKLKQMDSLHKLACAAEDGEALHSPPTVAMVTRPTTTLRGKLHFAHDAGHHPAPPTATVLADQRWTADHARADAAFRKAREPSSIAVYKAPAPHELGYLPVPTGVTAARAEPQLEPTDENYFQGTIFNSIKKLIEYGLYYADVPDPKTIEATLNGASKPTDALGTAATRRSGVWNEMLRDIAVSTDRLWTFVRTLSGLIGEDADSLLVTADEASAAAARDLQAQRKATAERVAAFQTKIVESLVSSMMKDSGLRLDTNAQDAQDKLVVINAETAKQINDLASGESGRPFFEANVALRALTDKGKGGKHKLGEVVAQLNGVVRELHTALDAELLSPQTAGASLAELSLPRNSYFVKLREDTTAAIRSAYDKFSVECAVKGVGRIRLWELIEGADHTLCTRFAEFVGHVLVQNRTSTGVSARYASSQQLVINASQAGNSLQRLLNHAGHYRANHPTPNFSPRNGIETLASLRNAYFQSYNETPETWANGAAAAAIRYAQDRHYKHVERVVRPGDQTPAWLKPWVSGVQY
jgi:hypothetical protein